MKKSQVLLTVILLVVSCVFTSPASAFFEPYQGKVIDADTKEPIEGAVVVAIWTREAPYFPSGESVAFKKARETLTDKNGEFSIKPYHHYSLRPLSKLWLRWVIFKPGYGSFPRHPKVKWQLDSGKLFRPYTVVELPKLKTRKERRKYLIGPPGISVPYNKTPLLIKAINIERVNLGFQPTFKMKEPKSK